MDADAARAAATSFGRFVWHEVKATLRARIADGLPLNGPVNPR